MTKFLLFLSYNYIGDFMLNVINKLLWAVATVFLVGGGIYFSFLYRFIQFDFKNMLKSFKKKKGVKITPFQTLTMALGARIGVGSLAGIALAIYMGGVGTIFWIWVTSIITSSNAFTESVMAVIYRQKDKDSCNGGPAYYIKKGLGNINLARIYAVLIIIAYIFGFLTIQTNTIAKSLDGFIGLPPIIIGIIVAMLSAIIIFSGVKAIANVTSKLVPIMGLGYLILGIIIMFNNISIIPNIFLSIIKEAFNFKALGIGVLTSFIIGVQRGIFSNEAGIGTGAIAASATDSNNPVGQGLVQVVGIYFTSLIVCTVTAIIILTSNYNSLVLDNINGIEITSYALNYHMGNFGGIVLILAIFFFSFSTIISGYYYGESNLRFLIPKNNKKYIMVLKIVTIIVLLYGSIANPTILWNSVDILVALMAIINIYSLVKMKNDVKIELDVYRKKK